MRERDIWKAVFQKTYIKVMIGVNITYIIIAFILDIRSVIMR